MEELKECNAELSLFDTSSFKENISSEPQAHDISTQTKSTENKIFMVGFVLIIN